MIPMPLKTKSASILILLLGISLVYFSCKKDLSPIEQFALAYNLDLTDYSLVIFIPQNGCGSCIAEGKKYVENLIDQPEILCVYVSRYAGDMDVYLNNPNFILDKQLTALNLQLLTTGAVVYDVKTNRLELFDPEKEM